MKTSRSINRKYISKYTKRYSYGFNGKEDDKETVGSGSGTQDYGMRIYNPSLGKFLSVDPITSQYPELTPYQFAGNTPIWATDLDGLEPLTFNGMSVGPGALGSRRGLQMGYYPNGLYNGGILYGRNGTTRLLNYTNQFKPIRPVSLEEFISFRNNSPRPARGTIAPNGQFIQTDLVLKSETRPQLNNIPKYPVASVYEPVSIPNYNEPGTSQFAYQSANPEALAARASVAAGRPLYRLGQNGVSKTGDEAQFWTYENPLSMTPEAFAYKYGISVDRVLSADFIETANLKNNGTFIIREAPPGDNTNSSSGGGLEVVVPVGGTTNNEITPLKK